MRSLSPPVLLLAALLAGPAAAQGNDDPVRRVEAYLRAIDTLKAEFTQSADGFDGAGTFWLDRPGRMRFEYRTPNRNYIVADGSFIYLWDAEAGEQSNAPIDSTLANFFLRPDASLSGDVTVTDVTDANGAIRVTLVQTDDPEAGRMTLDFAADPVALRGWSVTDESGRVSQVTLANLEAGLDLPGTLFVFRKPEDDRPGGNRGRDRR